MKAAMSDHSKLRQSYATQLAGLAVLILAVIPLIVHLIVTI